MKRANLIVVALIVAAAGCATAPREEASALAKRGAEASDLASRDVHGLAMRVASSAEVTAFNRTYDGCISRPIAARQACVVSLQPPANLEEFDQLGQAIDKRAEALTALGDAYRAFSEEAAYDAPADMQDAVGKLAGSVNGYADLLDVQGAIIRAPVVQLASRGAGLLAEEAQKKRLREGSVAIRLSVKTLREALEEEVELYDRLSLQFIRQENDAVRRMYEAGLIQRSPNLVPLASQLGVTLAPGAEGVLTNDLAARIAGQAYLEARLTSERRRQARRYAVLIGGLKKLEAAHDEFERDREPQLADLDRAMSEMSQLVSAREEDAE